MIRVSKTDDGRYRVVAHERPDADVTICLTFGEVDRTLRALGASNAGIASVKIQLTDSGMAQLQE